MNAGAAFSFAVVCEAEADEKISSDLAERVLLEQVDWLEPETLPAMIRWRGYDVNMRFLTWKSVFSTARRQGLRKHGKFRSSPGAYDESRARLALRLLRELSDSPDAVLLVRDTDNEKKRVESLEKVRELPSWTFPVVLATPHAKRESWVLAGFDPMDDGERERLRQVRQDLGFDPRMKAEQLTAEGLKGTKNAKTILARLVGTDKDREEACWQGTDISLLVERGRGSLLADYLDEISTLLVPLMSGRTAKA